MYTTHSQIIYEGDELSVFGLISYNTNSNELKIDDPIGFVRDGNIQ